MARTSVSTQAASKNAEPLKKEFIQLFKLSGWTQAEVARQLELTRGGVNGIITGRTVPKKPGTPEEPGNRPYPQRTPDPIVRTTVYDAAGTPIRARRHALNMVLYEGRAELRITFPAGVLNDVAKYSLMVMRRVTGNYDYDVDIFNPGSQSYHDHLSVCNQTLPSGGTDRARRMGWL